MSLKERIEPSQVLNVAVKIVAAGFLSAIPGIAGVTELHHRELTHQSLTLHPLLKEFIQWEMRVYAPVTRLWSAVHEIHHSTPDGNLKPFLDTMRAMEHQQGNPDQFPDIKIPESFPHLDPFVSRFSRKDVLLLGHYAENIMTKRLGEAYKRPSTYSHDQMQTLLYPDKSMYLYPEKQKDHKGEYIQEDIEEILLRDPHSPVLDPSPNGVQGILKTNVPRYQLVSRLFRNRRDLLPEYLQIDEVINHKKTRYTGFVEGSLVAAGIVLVARNKYEPKDFLKAVLAGTAINLVKLGVHIAGGNITNSLGHAGRMTPERFIRAMFGKEYKPILNPDGTVSTDSIKGGLLGRWINFITFGEVGGQDVHHKAPWQIAYTFAEGLKAWGHDPWGMLLDRVAHSKYFPFIKPGKGFEGKIRPDIASPAMKIIHDRRKTEHFGPEKIAA